MLTVPGAQATPVRLARSPQGRAAEGLGTCGTGESLSEGSGPRRRGERPPGAWIPSGWEGRVRAAGCLPGPGLPGDRASVSRASRPPPLEPQVESELPTGTRKSQTRLNNRIHNLPDPPRSPLNKKLRTAVFRMLSRIPGSSEMPARAFKFIRCTKLQLPGRVRQASPAEFEGFCESRGHRLFT